MKFKSMNKKLIAITGGLILASVFLSLALNNTNIQIYTNDTNTALAYSDTTTHPDLTREIITFYELSTGKKFTDEQKQLIVQGSIDEDKAPRWINHFYDPIFERGFQAENVGISGYLAKSWAQYSSYQTVNPGNIANLWTSDGPVVSGSWWGDFSYEAAIKDYSKDKEKESYLALGHILHLIEDMTVPEHTRNDPHPGGSNSSFYEDWARKNSSGLTQDLGKKIFNQGNKPIIYTDVESYFNNLAIYTNAHFFSPRTVNSKLYQNPKIVFEDGTFAYGKDENSEIYDLAIIDKFSNTKNINDPQILQEYWIRLSRQAIINGAGVIGLFLKEAETAKKAELAKQELEKRQLAQKSSFFGSIVNFFRNPGDNNQPALTITSEPTPKAPKIVKSNLLTPKPVIETENPKPVIVNLPAPPVAPKIKDPVLPAIPTPAPAPAPAPQNTSPVVYNGGGGGGGGSSSSNSNSATQENVEISTFQAGDLLINEIMYNLEGVDTDHEWIEIFNPKSNAVNLDGGKLFDGDGTTNSGLNAPPKNGGQGSLIIPAGGYAILAAKADIFLLDHQGFSGTVVDTVIDLKNSTDTIRLLAPDGTVLDEVTYSSSWGANGDGKTLERTNDPANWGVSSAIGGTPGAVNNWELLMSDINNATSTDDFAASTTTPVLGLGTDVSATTTISINTTWTLGGSPYRLFFDGTKRPTVAAGATLTIEPGVKIVPQGGNYTAMEIQGTLNAIATSGAPIIFTSINDADGNASTTPQKGDWLNIAFSQGAQGNLDYVEFHYGGQGLERPVKEMVKAVGAAVNINHSKFENSQAIALRLVDSSGVIENSTFTDNACGISVDSLVNGDGTTNGGCAGSSGYFPAVAETAPQVRNNQFIRNNIAAVESRNGSTPILDGNLFVDNGYPMRIESSYPLITDSRLENSTSSPNIFGGIAIDGYTHFRKDFTLKRDLPYILETNGPALSPYVDVGATLTIEPGVIFKTGHTFTALNVNGALIASTTPDNPIVFTSLKDDSVGGDTNNDGLASTPQNNDWASINFLAGSVGSFTNTFFNYAGYGSIPHNLPPINTLAKDFPAVTTSGNYMGITSGEWIAENSYSFNKIIFHNFSTDNPQNLGHLIGIKDSGNNFIASTELIGLQDVEETELTASLQGQFVAGERYYAIIQISQPDGTTVGQEDSFSIGIDESGASAVAFYELVPGAPANSALSIDAGATVVIQ
ncbi:MAG: lamin tail domain-containing protein [Candidatus Azambacteria bacterium]|nr:lamin tail domain-containing protein [Candidatus Azambacteria bacterium]